MAHIEKWINIEENGIYLVFGVTEENQLKFLHFSSKPFEGHRAPPSPVSGNAG